MSIRTASRCVVLLVLSIMLATLVSPGPARPAIAQPASDPQPPLAPIRPDSPEAHPAIDPRPLYERRRPRETRSTRGAMLAAARQQPQGMSASIPQEQAEKLQRLSKGLSFGAASQAPRINASPACEQLLFNTELTDGTGWLSYWATVNLDTQAYYTPPNSFIMVEDNDAFIESDNTDYDGFGQTFYFPSDAESVLIEFQVAFLASSVSDPPGDHLYYWFWLVDQSGNLINGGALGWGEVDPSGIADNQWHYFSDFVTDPSIVDPMRGQRVAILFTADGDGQAPFLDVSIDDVQTTACQTTSIPTGEIHGSVTQLGSTRPLSDAEILLTYYAPATNQFEVIDLTYPTPEGDYAFFGVADLPDGDEYQVWYLNDNTNTSRLGVWGGSIISDFSSFNSSNFQVLDPFDLKNVNLTTPVHEAEVVFPATFRWGSRSVAGDRYKFCLYDMETLDEVCSVAALTTPSFMLEAGDLEGIPGFTFAYGRPYAWYVRVLGTGYTGAAFEHIGYSYSANAVTFVRQSSTPPNQPTTPDPTPPESNSGSDWTVMVYIAGDNNLGDAVRYPNPTANLQGQFNTLKRLAASFPNINLVTLTDFYGNTGTQFCYLKPSGPPDCQQLGEQDTSNPAVLTRFINDSLRLYPANRTMLVLSDHGHSIAGFGSDETTSPTAVMTPNEIRAAFVNAQLNQPARKLDVLFYNACLMGSLEAAMDASPFADYLVASADEVWVLSVYERVLPLLAGPNKNNPRAVAAGIVEAYKRTIDALAPGLYISSAAYDLSKAAAVRDSLDALSIQMADNLNLSRAGIDNARRQMQIYDSSGNNLLGPEDAFVDLRHMAALLRSANNPAITGGANALLTALGPVGSGMVIASQQISGNNGQGGQHVLTNATGLSVFFPGGTGLGQQKTLSDMYLNKGFYTTYLNTTQWDEFLRVYTGFGTSSNLDSGPIRILPGMSPIEGDLPMKPVFLPLTRR